MPSQETQKEAFNEKKGEERKAIEVLVEVLEEEKEEEDKEEMVSTTEEENEEVGKEDSEKKVKQTVEEENEQKDLHAQLSPTAQLLDGRPWASNTYSFDSWGELEAADVAAEMVGDIRTV